MEHPPCTHFQPAYYLLSFTSFSGFFGSYMNPRQFAFAFFFAIVSIVAKTILVGTQSFVRFCISFTPCTTIFCYRIHHDDYILTNYFSISTPLVANDIVVAVNDIFITFHYAFTYAIIHSTDFFPTKRKHRIYCKHQLVISLKNIQTQGDYHYDLSNMGIFH